MQYSIIMVQKKNIHPNPDNPRYEAGDVTALSRSIDQEYLLSPLLVIPAPEFGDGHYMIEDGFRRWVSITDPELEIPCTVREPKEKEDLSVRALITGLVTDVHKEHLTAMERAEAYGRLRDENGMTQSSIARMLGLTDSTIGRYLSLLELSDKSKNAVRDGRLSVEKAVDAVQKHRAIRRKKQGKKPIDVGWEPDHFTDKHHLAKKARVMCDARNHSSRRRLGNIACGQCWEDAIRQDQTTVLQAAYNDGQKEKAKLTFVPPFATADGASRSGVIGNGI
jgi:ParB family transcriptional regulator, chromosome partitioning protein